ncbi:MAG TPA: type II toxin-antitoxin system VapC family toxin [Thermoanaerobaculia bacterium]|nr:type II toxin-antitoxin system VapC family toxin [Thermoanaerobaculia bacterium]
MRVFLDTSALTKRYVEEDRSEQVRSLCAQADALGVSVLVVPELISTLCRLVREGRLSPGDYRSLKTAVEVDLTDADLCDLSQEAFDQTLRCLERHPLRALDALHVGSALVYQPDLFVTADRRQAEAADGEGLAVMDLSRALAGR